MTDYRQQWACKLGEVCQLATRLKYKQRSCGYSIGGLTLERIFSPGCGPRKAMALLIRDMQRTLTWAEFPERSNQVSELLRNFRERQAELVEALDGQQLPDRLTADEVLQVSVGYSAAICDVSKRERKE